MSDSETKKIPIDLLTPPFRDFQNTVSLLTSHFLANLGIEIKHNSYRKYRI